MRIRIAALAVSALVGAVAADPALTQTPRPLALGDLASVRELSDPQRSPDGQWVAYVVTTADFEKDELFDEAARIVVTSGQVSISYLQRKLRIGFSRAARLVDMMEADGLVSAASGSKPREVLVDRNYFDDVDQQLR